MVNFNNYNITGMSYSGYSIIRAYACDGELVFGEEPPTPTPTGMTGLKVSGLTNSSSFSTQCTEGDIELIPHDLPTHSAITQMEVGTCVTIIGSNSLDEKQNVTEIILPSTIQWFRNYSFLIDDTSIQSLIIYATTPPRFQNYIEDEWTDIFGYRYPSSKAPAGFKIYVPSASLNAYKTAEGWNHMADYFVAIQ